ncbi:MAG: hypothetical protein ACXVEL_18015 [Nocardioidaceae bacterium]
MPVRLYLSSFRIGNEPAALLGLLRGGVRTALILNADDYKSDEDRHESLAREHAARDRGRRGRPGGRA